MSAPFNKPFVDQQVKAYKKGMELPEVWALYTKPHEAGDAGLAKNLTFESNWIAVRSLGLSAEQTKRVDGIVARRQRLLYMRTRWFDKCLKPDDPQTFVKDHVEDKK